MTRYYKYILISLLTVLSACSSDNADLDSPVLPPIDLTWEPEDIPGPSVTERGFECGDEATRSSWMFNGQKMVFGWEVGDAIGLFPTAGAANIPAEGQTWADANPNTYLIDPAVKKHPLYDLDDSTCVMNDALAQATPFYVLSSKSDSQTQQLFRGGEGDFEWDSRTRWTAYKAYNRKFNPFAEPSVRYTALPFDFTEQTQMALTDMQALYMGKGGYPKGYNNPVYISTDAAACKHLASVDFSVSPEMVWTGDRINFDFRHVGAIARLFLLAPEENLTLEKLELICDRKIFHLKGEIDITSHLYDGSAKNKGVRLVGDEAPIQMRPTDEPCQKVTLNFPQTYALKIEKPTAANRYSNYLAAYLMLYPIDYIASRDGNMFVYVTARDKEGKEVHFVSEPLSDKTMESGMYYQWNLRTHMDDGLYPIELTATMLDWRDIVGAGINTDLEK